MLEAVDQLVHHIDGLLLTVMGYFGLDDVPIDQLRIFLCLLAAFPISFLFRLLPNSANLKVKKQILSIYTKKLDKNL